MAARLERKGGRRCQLFMEVKKDACQARTVWGARSVDVDVGEGEVGASKQGRVSRSRRGEKRRDHVVGKEGSKIELVAHPIDVER